VLGWLIVASQEESVHTKSQKSVAKESGSVHARDESGGVGVKNITSDVRVIKSTRCTRVSIASMRVRHCSVDEGVRGGVLLHIL